MLKKRFGKKGAPWTANSMLPGGDFPYNKLATIENEIAFLIPDLDAFHTAGFPDLMVAKHQ
ncbi:hypothetical protein MF1_06210 [Bartonella quintana]|nr:hypothetical protein MF1_06210 [Bartonella quintana]